MNLSNVCIQISHVLYWNGSTVIIFSYVYYIISRPDIYLYSLISSDLYV